MGSWLKEGYTRFCRKMKLLLENPELRRDMGKHARETIVEKRSWNARIQQDLAAYWKVIGLCLEVNRS